MPDVNPTVDPALVADDQNTELAGLLYAGLVRLDASYHVVPSAATYAVSRNHRTYTFYIRHGLKFSNGDPITAKDFRFSITRSLNPNLKSPSAPTYLLDIQGASAVVGGNAKSVSGIRVVNNYTLQITTRWPVPYFLMELTYPTSFVLDQKRISKVGVTDPSWYTSPVSSGPYRLKTWVPGTKMVLVPNKHYWGPKPSLKDVTISFASLPSTSVYSYLTHNLDVAYLPAYQPGVTHQSGIHDTRMLWIDGMYMNLKSKPFNNRDVRKALTLALKRSNLVSKAMQSSVTPFGGNVPPGEFGYDAQLRPLPYDPGAARRSLRSAGFTGKKKFPATTLYYPASPAIGKLARSITQAWRKQLKITVDTKALTLNTLLANVQDGKLPLYLAGWSANYPDPHDWLSYQWKTHAIGNNVHYSDRQFDKLTATADVTWQGGQRLRLYNSAQQVLVQDAAWVPLYIPHRLVYIRPGVLNLVPTGYGLIPRGGSWGQVQFRSASSRPRPMF